MAFMLDLGTVKLDRFSGAFTAHNSVCSSPGEDNDAVCG